MAYRRLAVLIYIIIGVFVAWDRGYLDPGILRTIASALLAIVLWFLVLLGVNLHVHA
ncbi:MAG TPA: hypothetical protein VNW94_18250 [Streptosporangiaceae bacterium]|jgi:hypothetical protein|nr:hypothetical protein [Streptosporangiaceae bacterium]